MLNFFRGFQQRSSAKELLDDFNLTGPQLKQNLQNLANVNEYFGGYALVLNALKKIDLSKIEKNPVSIKLTDLGCGNGDMLRKLAYRLSKKNWRWQLTGVDANKTSIELAKTLSKNSPISIQYQISDIFSEDFKKQTHDIVLLCSICHHFSDSELIALLTQLQMQTQIIIISDWHRHWLPFSAIKILNIFWKCSYLEKHDGPLSIRKAFVRKELIEILVRAKIPYYQIKWRWPFRYQILILNSEAK